MGGLLAFGLCLSLTPLAMLRNFLGEVRHELHDFERFDYRREPCRREIEREEEIERLERQAEELRRW